MHILRVIKFTCMFEAFPFNPLFLIARGITPDLHFLMAQKLMLNQQQRGSW